jgi:hypothetical protein
MVEEKKPRKGARPTFAAQKLGIEGQGWVSNDIRSVQVLDLESSHTSNQANNFRSASPALPKST